MLRQLSATPCPVSGGPPQTGRRDSLFSIGDDTTANLDFTTEFKASFRDVKPRRPPGRAKRQGGNELGFTIHEEEELCVQHAPKPQMKDYSGISRAARRTSISHASQQPKQRVSFFQPDEINGPPARKPTFSTSLHKAPRRASLHVTSQSTVRHELSGDTLPVVPSPKISKPARRGTIYIPNDDTTMPSMYMGIFSPLKNEMADVAQGQERPVEEHTGLAAQMYKKRAISRRQSVLVASPKRGPLQSTSRPMQASVAPQDRIGSGPGKENFPPGGFIGDQGLMKKKARKSILVTNIPPAADASPRPARPAPRILERATSTSVRHPNSTASIRAGPISGSRPQPSKAAANGSVAPVPQQGRSTPSLSIPRKPQVPTRLLVPATNVENIDQSFPLLPEGLPEVSMYEDNWLGQQEVAISQLINNLFVASDSLCDVSDPVLLRLQLLEQYSSPDMVLTYKRVQGALLYGALSIPQDMLAGGHRLYSDLGRRKSFTDLWLETYEHRLLQAALEVVTGRTVNVPRRSSGPCSPGAAALKQQRILKLFIETFLMRNEDGHPDSETSQSAWSFGRTLLRSLMLIKILDLTKTAPGISISNLFRASSPHKASRSVVQALFQMLNPGAGDPLRALGHLGYVVSHGQHPLEEYEYPVQNLAIDLRDGIRLTRLVELLLYRSASQRIGHGRDADATATLLMPTGEILDVREGPRDWPLSQHLKFPCIGRATKLFNVQIALSAIQGVKGVGMLAHDVTAEDIVDGFREKTMKLLWGLTSKWGLEGLLDWEDVRNEIRRIKRTQGHIGYAFEDLELDDSDEGYMQCKGLLKAWAKVTAAAHGLGVRNFTTSFADGRVFEALVDEYERYLPTGDANQASKRSLTSRLKALGCSEQFAQLFAVGPGSAATHHIFDRDFVLASVAFLCSRLLGPSKKARAAVVLQRAWRERWKKVVASKKQVLKSVAEACAQAAQRKLCEQHAKGVIARAWRRYKATAPVQRIASLELMSPSSREGDIWLSL